MQKDWGRKRLCYQCSTMFYDFNHREIHCPECDAIINPDEILKKKIRTVTTHATAAVETADSALELEDLEEISGEDPESTLIGVIADDGDVTQLSVED